MKDNMLNNLAYYIRRSRELGLRDMVKRFWKRTKNELNLWGQSLWWKWKSRREMSDAALLARTKGGWRSLGALLDHLAGRPASSFLLPHESAQEAAQFLNQNYPEYFSAVLATADAACRNELSLQGQVFHFPNGINWHCDPVTGLRWPIWHRSRVIRYLISTPPTDFRKFQELNRHQHFITLGIAYWLTGDQRYVHAFCSQIQSWIETNPLQIGANWCYGLEVSLRILAWTVAFQFFRNSAEFREKTGRAFLKSLWQHIDFLNSHMQIVRTPFEVPNNHLISELTGLVLVGAAFPEFRAAGAWRETGLRLLNQQAPAQTHPDGVNKEQATGYHRFVAELLLLIVARSRQGALPHQPILETTLEGMLDYVFYSLTPIGTTPMWGDSASGRALGLGKNKDFWDFRPILSAGAALFGRADWKFAAGCFDEEAFWLLGSKGLEVWDRLDVRLPEQTSRAFPHAGLYVIRDAWAADTDVAFFRCGPFGLGGEGHCAHAHCDLLSFVLWVCGQLLLVDSGTYIYRGPLRNHFRLTSAHNTVMVDGREQATPKKYFNWQRISEAKCIDWTGTRVKAAMTYSGKVEFWRELAHPRPGTWELSDKFQGQGVHMLEWFFHFAPGLDLLIKEEEQRLSVLKEGRPFLTVHLPDQRIHYELREDWYSYQYDNKQSNQVLYAKWQGELEGERAPFHWKFQRADARSLAPGGH
jgi:hypothetical protein